MTTNGHLQVEVMTITPQMAKEWLRHNRNYRDVRPARVSLLAQHMRERWDLNGESIKFNSIGGVVDGQHRLLACIESGRSFQSLVVRGVDSDLNIDINLPRQLSDVLKHHKCKNALKVASAITFIELLSKDSNFSGNVSGRATRRQQLEILDRYPFLPDLVSKTQRVSPIESASRAAGMIAYSQESDSGVYGDHWIGVLSGQAESHVTDPVRVLRERLIKDRSSHAKLTRQHRMAFAIIAWNAMLEGVEMSFLRWSTSGANKQEFPRLMKVSEVVLGSAVVFGKREGATH